MSVADFDWAFHADRRTPVRIRTARGNTVVGRIVGYTIWRNLSPGSSATNLVHIHGIASTHPHTQNDYTSEPARVETLGRTPPPTLFDRWTVLAR